MNKNLSNYVFTAKYAKHINGTRETYPQTIKRMLSMFPFVAGLEEALINKEISSSQRALQFGGQAIMEKNARLYNCTVSFCDRLPFFSEAFYLLLCGCGVGFSVQKHHVERLPPLNRGEGTQVYMIADSIEGWSSAVSTLMGHYFLGEPRPLFDYSLIRPEGSPLRHGGKAPGFSPLKRALTRVSSILNDATKLTPLEAFDITMHLADAVISGGIRRSATIAIFSPDDEEMINSKTKDWFVTNPQRGRANISAMITPQTPKSVYDRLFRATKEFGEPACIFSPSTEYINNPCVEITMCPILIEKEGVIQENYTLDMFTDDEYTKKSGWQFCNLSTINAEKMTTKEKFLSSVRLATILGTLQASFTDMMDATTRAIVRRESLLGVSITGILANPRLLDWMSEGADLAKEVNKKWSSILGIAPASRITCVKPEGTASLVLGTCAGIHPYHAPKFIRRVQANKYEDIYKLYSAINPESCSTSVWGDPDTARVIAFPCIAPPSSITSQDLGDIEHLEIALRVNKEWVRRGTAFPARLEGAHHNVSITVSVEDWDSVQDYLWENRAFFTGVSLLSSSGDYDYDQAPLQAVHDNPDPSDPHYLKKVEIRDLFYSLLDSEKKVDFSKFTEEEDNTNFNEAGGACSGGSCELEYYEKEL